MIMQTDRIKVRREELEHRISYLCEIAVNTPEDARQEYVDRINAYAREYKELTGRHIVVIGR